MKVQQRVISNWGQKDLRDHSYEAVVTRLFVKRDTAFIRASERSFESRNSGRLASETAP